MESQQENKKKSTKTMYDIEIWDIVCSNGQLIKRDWKAVGSEREITATQQKVTIFEFSGYPNGDVLNPHPVAVKTAS